LEVAPRVSIEKITLQRLTRSGNQALIQWMWQQLIGAGHAAASHHEQLTEYQDERF